MEAKMMDIALFIYYCRSIARLKGSLAPVYVWPCSPWPSPVVYEDAQIKIMSSFATPALYVEMLLPHTNPVVCVDVKGRLYRVHGERKMLEDHIKKLAVLEKPTTPAEQIFFLTHWGDWFYKMTNSFEGKLGVALAYLYMGIVKGTQIDLHSNAALVQLLKRNEIPGSDPIWSYINIVRDT